MGETTSCCVSREPIGPPPQQNLNLEAIVKQEKELNSPTNIRQHQKRSTLKQVKSVGKTRKTQITTKGVQKAHKRMKSFSSATKLSDEARILRANKYYNIPEVIELIQSNVTIQSDHSASHPWETTPDTVGSLALCLLIEWSIMGVPDRQQSKVILECMDNNIVTALNQVLDIQQISRTQNALVLLTILLVECGQYIFEDLKENLPTFINLLDNHQEGMRNSACAICKHILSFDQKSKTQFIIIGGLRKILRMLLLSEEDNEILLDSLQLLKMILYNEEEQMRQYNLKRAQELNLEQVIQDLNNFSRPNEIKEEIANIQALLE